MTYLIVVAALFTDPSDIVDGDSAKDRLWLRAEQGTVTVYDRASGKSSVAAEHVLSTDRAADGGVIALISVALDLKKGTYEFRDLAPQAAIASRFSLDDDKALAIIAGNGPQTIVTAKTIMSLEKGSWQAARLTAPLSAAGVIHAVQAPDGVLLGSEGGPLYSISRLTGLTREVKLADVTMSSRCCASGRVIRARTCAVSCRKGRACVYHGPSASPGSTKIPSACSSCSTC